LLRVAQEAFTLVVESAQRGSGEWENKGRKMGVACFRLARMRNSVLGSKVAGIAGQHQQ
jgi:hypothetical protein